MWQGTHTVVDVAARLLSGGGVKEKQIHEDL